MPVWIWPCWHQTLQTCSRGLLCGAEPIQEKRLVKACMSQLAAKTASELIVCVARTDRVDEMAKLNISEFPFPEAPPAIKSTISTFPTTTRLVI